MHKQSWDVSSVKSAPLILLAQRRLLVWALPRLTELQPGDWNGALRRARAVDFDSFERAGILLSLAIAAYLLRFDAGEGALLHSLPLVIRYLLQFMAAVPLLGFLSGGFYLRSMRRGLSCEIDRQFVQQRLGMGKN